MIKMIVKETGRPLFVITEPGVSAARDVMLSESELDQLQMEICIAKYHLYQERRKHARLSKLSS